ncbi:Hypothetical protein IALB_1220 [Ignavibacterium album JCM 16511]|uniref:Uncharacterized protein n=1 Tax=Ignavibacterium album (strain DSM 19864 / JCM 16511 / NBRC 101810 / Mat9-16) TaxID=945713 RepID=I0AIX4_IGNAJ|nr:Hypothetical protein IALB_1220 [Ignavibacterium album JCM 16511]
MVRLKLFEPIYVTLIISPSQFHYGSIKTRAVEKNQSLKGGSQFHYGSIKTKIIRNEWKLKNASQFHYGSIKTIKSPLN